MEKVPRNVLIILAATTITSACSDSSRPLPDERATLAFVSVHANADFTVKLNEYDQQLCAQSAYAEHLEWHLSQAARAVRVNGYLVSRGKLVVARSRGKAQVREFTPDDALLRAGLADELTQRLSVVALP